MNIIKHKNYILNDDMKKLIKVWIDNKTPVSYSYICEKFNWVKANGNSKKAQIKLLEQNYIFDYIGNHSHKKIIFYGIKNKILINKPLTKRGEYSKYIDKIIMQELNINKYGLINGSYFSIAKTIGLLHNNFFYTKYNLYDIESSLGYPHYFLNNFVEIIIKKISKILERSFNRLENAGYIKLKRDIIIKFIDNDFIKIANQEDKEKILLIKQKTVKNLGYNTIQEVVKDKKGLEYKNELNINIKECGIDFFYDSYILQKLSEEIEEIDHKEHYKLVNDFNSLFIKNCISYFEKELLNFSNKKNRENISSKTYFELNKFLVYCLLDNKSIYNLKAKTILENGEEKHCYELENGYYWTFLNNMYGNVYIKDFSYLPR